MTDAPQLIVGWREWVGLPNLGLPLLKAKIDTGARTSALHAFSVERFRRERADWVRFLVHPLQGRNDLVVDCEAALLDQRLVTDSGGHREERPVIATMLALGDALWPVEVTLTDRDSMRFRMLVGRTALTGRALVDVRRSFVTRRCKAPGAIYTDQSTAGRGGFSHTGEPSQ
jgi:hypothetical protein